MKRHMVGAWLAGLLLALGQPAVFAGADAVPGAADLELSTEDLELICGPVARSTRERDDKPGQVPGVVLPRVSLKVQGRGSFTANHLDTAKGQTGGIFAPGARLNLRAKPAAGARFDQWLLNGNFSSESPTHFAHARVGLEISAVFKDTRSLADGTASEEVPPIAGPDLSESSVARLCKATECDGCISSDLCAGGQVGDPCTFSDGKKGTCSAKKTCGSKEACCTCER